MRKALECFFTIAGLLVVLFAGMLVGSYHSHVKAQSTVTAPADVVLTVGRMESYTLSANEFAAVPVCSLAQNCKAQLQLCNFQPPPHPSLADSTHCITITPNDVGTTNLWMGVSDTVTTPATATTSESSSITPFQIGTAAMWVQPAEVKQTP